MGAATSVEEGAEEKRARKPKRSKYIPTPEYTREDRERIGRKLQYFRKQQHLTANRLGVLAEMSHQQIREIESGRANSPIGTYMRLARVVGVPLAELICGAEVDAAVAPTGEPVQLLFTRAELLESAGRYVAVLSLQEGHRG